MENVELENSKVFKVVDILEYLPHSVVIKSILRKTTGNIRAVSFDSGEVLAVKISPFDTLIQIIDGESEIIIDDKYNLLKSGESIIIPAHTRNTIKAKVRFKMISTIIKSGYEEVSL
jgi:quercetin dioxygenase-like cupin family protein